LVLGQQQHTIGGGFNASEAFFGEMDEVRVWSLIRSASDIAQNQNTSLVGATDLSGNTAEAGLVAYYRFDEALGGVGHDAARHGHDATIGSGVLWFSHAFYCAGTALDLGNGLVDEQDIFEPLYPFSFTMWVRIVNSRPGPLATRSVLSTPPPAMFTLGY